MKNILLFFVVTGIVVFSCKKDKPVESTTDFGYNYFPDEVGRYIIYEVDSIHYDDKNHTPHDTTRYLLKEKIESSFLDNSGRQTLRIERYYKFYKKNIPYDSIPWKGPRVWTANRTQSVLEKKEENIIYLKLIFPVKKGKLWNGNAYNTLEEKEYEMISVDEAENISSVNFDSVVTVKQFEQINVIQYRYEMEKFARNVGLIYKERDSLHFSSVSSSPPYDDTVGYTYTQKIVSYGK